MLLCLHHYIMCDITDNALQQLHEAEPQQLLHFWNSLELSG